VPTRQDYKTVSAMVSYGITEEKVADVLGIDPKTLRKYFEREIAIAATEANAKMASTLYNKGIAGDVTCMIFWLKTRARWSERVIVENPNAVDFDPSDMTDAEIKQRIARLQRVQGSKPIDP
jgi:hypothetical protein